MLVIHCDGLQLIQAEKSDAKLVVGQVRLGKNRNQTAEECYSGVALGMLHSGPVWIHASTVFVTDSNMNNSDD